jgi:hypothetical protein
LSQKYLLLTKKAYGTAYGINKIGMFIQIKFITGDKPDGRQGKFMELV